jgi:hypothetical protein
VCDGDLCSATNLFREEAGKKAGIPMPLARNIKDVLQMDAFTKSVG